MVYYIFGVSMSMETLTRTCAEENGWIENAMEHLCNDKDI